MEGSRRSSQGTLELQILEHIEVPFEAGAVGKPNQGAMEILSLLAHGLAIPKNLAGFE